MLIMKVNPDQGDEWQPELPDLIETQKIEEPRRSAQAHIANITNTTSDAG